MKYFFQIILFSIILMQSRCGYSQKETNIKYNFSNLEVLKKPITHKDSALIFSKYALSKNFTTAKEIYPDFFSLDVSLGKVEIEGREPQLVGVSSEVFYKYIDDSYSLLTLGTFLRAKHNANDDFYDLLLRECIIIDTSNVAAMYLLSQLRYQNGISDDAFYLVNKMKEINPDNKEINRLYTSFQNHHRPLSNELPSLDEFIKQKVAYQPK